VVESAQKATIFGFHLYDKLLFRAAGSQPLSTHVIIVIVITVALSATTTFMTVRQSAKRGLMQTGNMDPTNPMAQSQKFMQYIVPFFSLTGLYWQYGLVLYWVTTNLWTLGQQYFMFRNWTTEPVGAQGATAAAPTDTPVRTTRSSLRPQSGSAKAASGGARTGTASGGARTGTSSSGAKTGTASGRATSGSARAKGAGSGTSGTGNGSGTRTGSASGTRAANAARPLPVPERTPPEDGFVPPPVAGRSELCVARTVAPGAPAVAGSGGAQFLNMKYCWPIVHRFVVTQYSTSPYCQ